MYYCICFNTRNNIKKKITFLYSTQTWLFQEKKKGKNLLPIHHLYSIPCDCEAVSLVVIRTELQG